MADTAQPTEHRKKNRMSNINVSDLTTEQLKAIRTQLKAQAKQNGERLGERRAIIDAMLQDQDDTGFMHTTADILAALQEAGLVSVTLDKDERAEWLKKVQTRKQDLEKKPEFAGKVGYKASSHGFSLTPDRVVDWLLTNSESLTPVDRKAIIKAMKAE